MSNVFTRIWLATPGHIVEWHHRPASTFATLSSVSSPHSHTVPRSHIPPALFFSLLPLSFSFSERGHVSTHLFALTHFRLFLSMHFSSCWSLTFINWTCQGDNRVTITSKTYKWSLNSQGKAVSKNAIKPSTPLVPRENPPGIQARGRNGLHSSALPEGDCTYYCPQVCYL